MYFCKYDFVVREREREREREVRQTDRQTDSQRECLTKPESIYLKTKYSACKNIVANT